MSSKNAKKNVAETTVSTTASATDPIVSAEEQKKVDAAKELAVIKQRERELKRIINPSVRAAGPSITDIAEQLNAEQPELIKDSNQFIRQMLARIPEKHVLSIVSATHKYIVAKVGPKPAKKKAEQPETAQNA